MTTTTVEEAQKRMVAAEWELTRAQVAFAEAVYAKYPPEVPAKRSPGRPRKVPVRAAVGQDAPTSTVAPKPAGRANIIDQE